MDEVDFHQQEEDRFAVDAADLLKRRALANEFESLIIVAPPRTLGELRKHYHSRGERQDHRRTRQGSDESPDPGDRIGDQGRLTNEKGPG